MSQLADIGLIGLAVMGENLVLNIESKGYTVAVYNRTLEKVNRFVNGRGKDKKIIGTQSIFELIKCLKRPRKIMMMVKAGPAVDDFIIQIIPFLDPGDIIIDGGNSNFLDTIRRTKLVESKGFYYIGTGVSGGEEGALHGPSIMPGGSAQAWMHIKPIFQDIAAKVSDGTPCCDWVGADGSGHFIKMVHNGIEYGDMQLISEAYHIMRELLDMTPDEMHEVFEKWNKGDLNSYLIEITSEIMAYKDDKGTPMLDKILDSAGQKGTGKWAGTAALELGIPLTLIGESVFARFLSSQKNERVKAAEIYNLPKEKFKENKKDFIENIRQALYASKLISYAQGFMMMKEAASIYRWNLNYGSIAMMWRGGCIIRSIFLDKIKEAYDKNPLLENLLLDPYFRSKITESQKGWRKVVSSASLQGMPVPAFSSALSYFDGYRSELLPANLIQALRDYFGAHMYERIDKPRGEFFHTDWTGKGGKTVSTAYNA